MPGRQSTGPPSIRIPKPKKLKAKRSLNALAIAEQQNPRRIKIGNHRLGESEHQGHKRQRQYNEDEGSEEDEGAASVKRRKGQKDRYGNDVELGSDSSGNEWMVGQVDSDDDSSLDSDEAMGSSDHERFEGFTFRGSSSTDPKRKSTRAMLDGDAESDRIGEVDLREDDDVEESEESEGLGDDVVDLATMLDDEGEAQPGISKKSQSSGEDASGSESEDEDGDKASDFEDAQSELSISEDENDTIDPTKLASLHALVSTMKKEKDTSSDLQVPADVHESITPSEFSLTSRRKLTVADLMPSVTDPRLKKSLKLMAESGSTGSSGRGGIPRKLEAPLPKRQQDRIDRTVAYEKSKETLNRWIDTVKHNRRAEHLSFPLQNPKAVAAQGSQRLLNSSQSKPLTDLEGTIQNILQESGLAPQNGKSEEDQLQAFEEMQTNKMPIEEVQARRAELRRARELLFREEIRAKRIKRIKSKSYRKIHRKERERNNQFERDALAANGISDSEHEKEQNDRRRAEERMGARHRESKWVKGVKDSGRAKWDEDARNGVTEMARRGEELRMRIAGKRVRADDDDENSMISKSDQDENGDDLYDDDEVQRQRLIERVQRLKEDGKSKSENRGNRLSNMDFMKKAEAAKSARNDAELEDLRRELAGEETQHFEEADEASGRQSFGPQKAMSFPSATSNKVQRGEFEERDGSDDEKDDYRDAEEEDVDIIVEPSGFMATATASTNDSSGQMFSEPSLGNRGTNQKLTAGPWNSMNGKGLKASSSEYQALQPDMNVDDTPPTGQPIDKQQTKPRSILQGSRVAAKATQTTQPQRTTIALPKSTASQNSDDETDIHPVILRNQELIAQAFAGDNVALDFSKEKEELTHAEEPQIQSTALPGWGTWTGSGIGSKALARQIKHQRKAFNKNFTTTPGIAPEKRQDAKLANVIINEKRVKKNSKYLASNLPHPFETRQQYERSLRLPVGPEWTTKETFQGMTKPRVIVKGGVIGAMERPIV